MLFEIFLKSDIEIRYRSKLFLYPIRQFFCEEDPCSYLVLAKMDIFSVSYFVLTTWISFLPLPKLINNGMSRNRYGTAISN